MLKLSIDRRDHTTTQWYCAVTVSRARKTTTSYVMALFRQFKVAFGAGKQFGCQGSATDLAEELTALPRL